MSDVDLSCAPHGATHYYKRDGITWWYKKQDGGIYYPSENYDRWRWVLVDSGRDINHAKWLEENLVEIKS